MVTGQINGAVGGQDCRLVRKAFDRLSLGYEAASGPDQEIGRRLLDHLAPVSIEPTIVLDIGSGTGGCARRLGRSYRKANIVALDVAPAMLRESRRQEPWFRSRQRLVCSDAHHLAIATNTIDLVYSNLTLPWCSDVVLDTEIITLQYRSLSGLFTDLKRLGTGNLAPNRRRTLTGCGKLARLRQLYRPGDDNLINATMEVTYAHAWSPPTRESVIPTVDLG